MTVTENDVNSIIDRFDFKKIHAYMKLVGWKWYNAGAADGIPSVEELRWGARKALSDLGGSGRTTESSSGGFIAQRSGDTLSLVFAIEQHETYL